MSKGVKLIRDKRDTNYKDSFTEFMKSIRETDYVIMVISDSYLKSRNCMYEVLEFTKDESYKKRILPIILSDAYKVYSPKESLDYLKYWGKEITDLDDALLNISPENALEIFKEKKVFQNIQGSIIEFTAILRDMKQVPFNELKENNFIDILNEIGIITSEEVTKLNYEIVKQEEIIHSMAKRYSAKLLVDRNHNREEIRKVISEVTENLKLSKYYRNKTLKEYWKDTEAHVVWLFLYHDLEDIKMVNWICRTSWIDEELPKEAKPLELSGNDKVDNIIIEWNENYESQKMIFQNYKGTKEEVIEGAEAVAKGMIELSEDLKYMYSIYQKGEKKIEDIFSYVDETWDKVNDLYFEGTDLPVGPVECSNYSQTAQEIFATCHNMFLYFSEKGRKGRNNKNIEFLMNMSIKDLNKLLIKFEIDRERLN